MCHLVGLLDMPKQGGEFVGLLSKPYCNTDARMFAPRLGAMA